MKTESSVAGSWRITGMELWAPDVLDLDGPAHLTFEADRLGSFQFIAVHGSLDYRVTSADTGVRVEFSWEGFDEGDPRCGRGWAVLSGAVLTGRFYFHNGDDSAFTAERMKPTGRRGRPLRLGV